MRIFRLSLSVAMTFALAACASTGDTPTTTATPTQPANDVTEGIGRYMQQRARVEAVGFRLRKTAAQQCTKLAAIKPDLGLVVWSLANFETPTDRARLQSEFDLTERVTIALAVEGAPASASGLRPGQVVTHVNDQAVHQGKGATERFVGLSTAAARQGIVRLRLADGSEVALTPEAVCEYPALLVRSPEINAAADGRTLAVTSGLLEQTRSDDELALVLGHELAHNVLGHLKNSSAGKPIGILGAVRATIGAALAVVPSRPYTVSAEKEADYAGLYFMARAGYDIGAAEPFLRRMYDATRATSLVKTHPSGPERLAAMRSTIAEIKAKKKATKPLEPDLKPRR